MSKGTHTWEIYLHYYKCPLCAYILADRNPYHYKPGGKYFKDLACPRCSHEFTVYKVRRPSMGSFSDEERPVEMEWND